MKTLQNAYIVAAKRSPIGRAHKGSLRHLRPDELLVQVIAATLKEVQSLPANAIEDFICGCAMPEAEQGLNIARIAAVLANLPTSVAGITVNRFCASGLSAITTAAHRIQAGEADVILAGGVESMSMVPMMGNTPSLPPDLFADNSEHSGLAWGMGITAEEVAKRYQVSRQDQDAFAYTSHQRALKAQQTKAFAAEIAPITVTQRQLNQEPTTFLLEQDEGPRADTSLDALAALKPVFTKDGSVTAGNSSQTSDGAAVLVVVSEKALREYQLKPLARFASSSLCGVPPEVMGIGPVHAIPQALTRAGLNAADLDWIELNEAFAAQSLAVIRKLELNPERVNPLGGAIALGHPLGASGAIRAATAIHALQRENLRYGMVTMCVGMGQGMAAIFERV